MKKILFLLIILLIPISLSGFPSVDDETSFIDSMRQTSENDIQNPRASGRSFRKASEDKHPWEGSFPEMELMAWPDLDSSPRPIEPIIIQDLDPKTSNRPDYGVGTRYGCFIVGPEVWNYFSPYNGYSLPNLMDPIEKPFEDSFLMAPTIITDISLKGPADIVDIEYLDIWVKAYENITKKSPVIVSAKGVSFYDIGNGPQSYDVECSHKTIVYPTGGGCECIGTTPTIDDDDADNAIPSAGSVHVWVDSGGLACPPYTWTVSGTGWSLSASTTENDLETVTLSLINTTGKTCGTHYSVYATVTVTDNCGVTDDIEFRYSGGKWVFIKNVLSNNACVSCGGGGCGGTACASFSQDIISGNEKWAYSCNSYTWWSCETKLTPSCWNTWNGTNNPPCGTPYQCWMTYWDSNPTDCCTTSKGPSTCNYMYYTWSCP